MGPPTRATAAGSATPHGTPTSTHTASPPDGYIQTFSSHRSARPKLQTLLLRFFRRGTHSVLATALQMPPVRKLIP
jgi:hypothetical protein